MFNLDFKIYSLRHLELNQAVKTFRPLPPLQYPHFLPSCMVHREYIAIYECFASDCYSESTNYNFEQCRSNKYYLAFSIVLKFIGNDICTQRY